MDNKNLVRVVKYDSPTYKEDLQDILQQVVDMAMESESLALDRKLVDISLDYFLKDPSLGKYFLYDDKNREGSCFITYEKNIYYDADILWFQSVNVKKDYRKQGVFRRMFQEVERLGKSLNTSLKLYVEVENHTAIAVYKKMNMERVNQLVYDYDITYHQKKLQFEDQKDYVTKLATVDDYDEIIKFMTNSESLLSQKPQVIIKLCKDLNQRIKQVIQETKKEGAILITKKGNEIVFLTAFSVEFTDWRFGLIIWVYDFIVKKGENVEYKILFQESFRFLQSTDQVQPEIKCIRYQIESKVPNVKDLTEAMEKLGITQSHYYVYQKILQ